LSDICAGTTKLVAHPGGAGRLDESVDGAVTLAIGPEGGWVEAELASLENVGFSPVSLGPRILRVETAVAALLSRLFRP
jgi:RsmE family RNA methyltransferase